MAADEPVEQEEELLDYEEEEEATEVQGAKAGEAVKKGYVGIHSTGFKDFLLKPELLRAIVDCGFEHPSEGAPRVDVLLSLARGDRRRRRSIVAFRFARIYFILPRPALGIIFPGIPIRGARAILRARTRPARRDRRTPSRSPRVVSTTTPRARTRRARVPRRAIARPTIRPSGAIIHSFVHSFVASPRPIRSDPIRSDPSPEP
jgi:hypothetical protein